MAKVVGTAPQVVWIEAGQPLRTMGRDCVFIGVEGAYTSTDMVRVQDVLTGRTWSLRLDRITSRNYI